MVVAGGLALKSQCSWLNVNIKSGASSLCTVSNLYSNVHPSPFLDKIMPMTEMICDRESVLTIRFMLLPTDTFACPALKSWFKIEVMLFR